MSFPDSVHALVRDTTAVWGFVTAVGIVLLLTPLVARLAPLVGGVDDKHDRPRVHGADAAARAAIICGAPLGFLRYNFHPARVFMGDTGALALGFLLACVAVQGVLKTAATIALAGPLLVMAVPILDTSFVIAKRLKYKRSPFAPDQNHFYHRFMRIGYSQRRTAAYLHLWALLLAAYALLLRFEPPRPLGHWQLDNTLIALGVGIFVLAASVWIVYTLEIIKSRHLQVLRRGKVVQEPEREEAVERALTAGGRH